MATADAHGLSARLAKDVPMALVGILAALATVPAYAIYSGAGSHFSEDYGFGQAASHVNGFTYMYHYYANVAEVLWLAFLLCVAYRYRVDERLGLARLGGSLNMRKPLKAAVLALTALAGFLFLSAVFANLNSVAHFGVGETPLVDAIQTLARSFPAMPWFTLSNIGDYSALGLVAFAAGVLLLRMGAGVPRALDDTSTILAAVVLCYEFLLWQVDVFEMDVHAITALRGFWVFAFYPLSNFALIGIAVLVLAFRAYRSLRSRPALRRVDLALKLGVVLLLLVPLTNAAFATKVTTATVLSDSVLPFGRTGTIINGTFTYLQYYNMSMSAPAGERCYVHAGTGPYNGSTIKVMQYPKLLSLETYYQPFALMQMPVNPKVSC